MRSFVCLFVLYAVVVHLATFGQGATFVAINFFSSCTGLQTVLPNLSYAKASITSVPPAVASCSSSSFNVVMQSQLTWYFYPTYPVVPACNAGGSNPGVECCHSTATSTLNFTSTNTVTTPIEQTITVVGTVLSGPFQGSSLTRVTTFPTPNVQCSSAVGLEARAGLITLTITNAWPLTSFTCTGVVTQEMCPGALM